MADSPAALLADAELLALMREQYQYATLEAHMLADGVLHLRCHACQVNPVPAGWHHVAWCDSCMTECRDSGEAVQDFVVRKRMSHEDT